MSREEHVGRMLDALTDEEAVIEAVARLDPEKKLAVLEAMGFTRSRLEHGVNCLSRQGSGLRCDCVPPESQWRAPADVRKHLGETWEARTAHRNERDLYFNDGIGRSPAPWEIL